MSPPPPPCCYMKPPGNVTFNFSKASRKIEGKEANVKESFQTVIAHLQNDIARGTFPSAQFVIGQRGQLCAAGALGYAVLEPEKIPATENTLYDLASLTKPLVTTLLTVKFAERGLLDLGEPASNYLEELRNTDKQALTLLQLLTHTSGL